MKLRFLFSGCLFLSCVGSVAWAEKNPFEVVESTVEPSPQTEKALVLEPGESVVDFDISPLRPEAALLIRSANGQQKILFWKIAGNDSAAERRVWVVPTKVVIASLTWHPLGDTLFLLTTQSGHQEIIKTPVSSWNPKRVYKTQAQLRRLVVAPRPFAIAYDEKTNDAIRRYRLFFGVKGAGGHYSTHSITTEGEKEYKVLDVHGKKVYDEQGEETPHTMAALSALPVGFHPAGHLMLWEDAQHCFQKAHYGEYNWTAVSQAFVGHQICQGSLTYTPNGAFLMQWKPEEAGVMLHMESGKQPLVQAQNFKFISTPSSTPDGLGIVGVTQEGAAAVVHYVPIKVPLADVMNAWMFFESPRDRELFLSHGGLFRTQHGNQLFELYDTESYYCGGYSEATPTRPYFVTTDIFWELYSAAFEGIFILSERQTAILKFWNFVESAHQHLKASPQSKMAQVFAALMEVRKGQKSNPEAAKILGAKGIELSSITNKEFNFGVLTPRSHYVVDSQMQRYFRAFKYLTTLKLDEADIVLLRHLPAATIQHALAWIDVYTPFIAPARGEPIWQTASGSTRQNESLQIPPQLFPLSWGFDNQTLSHTVYQSSLPEKEQIKGPGGQRVLPSGLDLAAVLGSRMAEIILEESGEFQKYPPLKTQIGSLKKRWETSLATTPQPTLYEQWLSSLATQWSDNVSSPGNTIQKKLWSTKRLQTGLASWATLRHATVLVNEFSPAECGEGGFERILLRPPRGFVEPDPATFEAIAQLFESTIAVVKNRGASWKGLTPHDGNSDSPPDKEVLQKGLIRRLTESRDKVRFFRDLAQKELKGQPLTADDYSEIFYVGRAAEHNFLVFKSLAQKDFALSVPDPMAKVTEVAAASDSYWLVGVGAPLEWDQIVPFFGRKQIVKGSVYSYYEMPSNRLMTDATWRTELPLLPHPAWITPYMSQSELSCPAKAP